VTPDEVRALVETIPHWHHRFELAPGVFSPGSYDPEFIWSRLDINKFRSRRTVLDIGASDGFFTRQATLRGADVTAVDFRPKNGHGFGVMEQVMGRTFPYIHANVFELDTESLGTFDIVLFLGVLYHLPDMIRALHKVRALCGETLFLETHSDNDFCPKYAAARYYKSDSLAGDPTNFWSPNTQCVIDMLHDVGFDVVCHEAWGDRMLVEAKISTDPSRAAKMAIAYGRL